MDWSQVIAVLGVLSGGVSASLAWLAKLQWSQEFKDAKEEQIKTLKGQIDSLKSTQEETLKAKESEVKFIKEQLEHLQVKESELIKAKDTQIETLQGLNSVAIYDHYLKQKQALEKIISELNAQVDFLMSQNNKIKETAQELSLSSTSLPPSNGEKQTGESQLEGTKSKIDSSTLKRILMASEVSSKSLLDVQQSISSLVGSDLLEQIISPLGKDYDARYYNLYTKLKSFTNDVRNIQGNQNNTVEED